MKFAVGVFEGDKYIAHKRTRINSIHLNWGICNMRMKSNPPTRQKKLWTHEKEENEEKVKMLASKKYHKYTTFIILVDYISCYNRI